MIIPHQAGGPLLFHYKFVPPLGGGMDGLYDSIIIDKYSFIVGEAFMFTC